MRVAVAGLSVALLTGTFGTAPRPENGSLCIAKYRDSELLRSAPGFDCPATSRSLQIDTRPRMPWPEQSDKEIPDLPLEGIHRIRLFCDGKPLQSFTFRFSEFRSNRLCLYLNDRYQTPQLKERTRQTPWCKCN